MRKAKVRVKANDKRNVFNVPERLLMNELHRFNTMSHDQLLKRLARIKNPRKAEAMRIMATWCEERKLVRAAKRRRDELTH